MDLFGFFYMQPCNFTRRVCEDAVFLFFFSVCICGFLIKNQVSISTCILEWVFNLIFNKQVYFCNNTMIYYYYYYYYYSFVVSTLRNQGWWYLHHLFHCLGLLFLFLWFYYRGILFSQKLNFFLRFVKSCVETCWGLRCICRLL